MPPNVAGGKQGYEATARAGHSNRDRRDATSNASGDLDRGRERDLVESLGSFEVPRLARAARLDRGHADKSRPAVRHVVSRVTIPARFRERRVDNAARRAECRTCASETRLGANLDATAVECDSARSARRIAAMTFSIWLTEETTRSDGCTNGMMIRSALNLDVGF